MIIARVQPSRAVVPPRVTFVLVGLVTGVALLVATGARADSTPVGRLPPGPVSRTATTPGQLLAVALPRGRRGSGLVWRIARRYDPRVVQQLSEAVVGRNVVLVFEVVGRGDTSLAFALTRGDVSPAAVKAVTHRIHSA
jgi:hypothetical protein